MKNYKKYYIIPASPREVYLALTTASTLLLWTGDIAEMTAEPGSEFSLWDGSIVGKNLAFEENKKITQEWYFGEQENASIVTIKLHPHKHGTSVELHHDNIPDTDFDAITEGWDGDYFGALADFYRDEG